MGISLVEQEPVAMPKTRTLNSVEEDFSSEKKKSVPQKTVCIITEFLEQGSLADILYGPTRLPAEIWTYELILACALQAARGMLYLHSHQPPICHRDLKSSNLVVDDHWVVKVTDFGMSRIVPEKVQEQDKGIGDDDRESLGRDSTGDFSRHEGGSIMVTSSSSSISSTSRKTVSSSNPRHSMSGAPEMTSNVGTTAWCAPEVFTASNRARYSVKVDVYSFGMVLWELWEKKRPFEELTSRFDIMDAIRGGKRPLISDNTPPAYKALIQRCWHTEPSRRPMFHYIVRYLKDELGRVKRQKALPSVATSRPSTSFFRPSFSALNNPHPPAPNAVQVIPPTALHSVVASENTVDAENPLHTEPDSHASEQENSAEGNERRFPEGRTPLVKAFDRSLSYLTESPALDSPILQKHLQGFNNTQLYGNHRNFASAVTDGTDRLPNNTSNFSHSSAFMPSRMAFANNWRDRYVMKFSGWNSSKPDTGLPPSLAPPPGSSPSLHSSALSAALVSNNSQNQMRTQDSGRVESESPIIEQPQSPGYGADFVPSVFKLDPDKSEVK
jgi:serine/threonine protein kinase